MPVTPRRGASSRRSVPTPASTASARSGRRPARGRGGRHAHRGGVLAARGHVVLRPEQDADALVPELHEVPERLLHRRDVVARDGGESETVDRRVDQHRGQLQLDEPRVVVVVHVPSRTAPPAKMTPRPAGAGGARRSRTRDAARGLDAEHGRVPVLGQPPPIASASAGKIGFCSSGITRPTSWPVRRGASLAARSRARRAR